MIKFLLCILSLLCLCWVGPSQNPNPQPYHLTWVVIDTSTGEILTQTSKVTPPNIWLLDLTFELTKLVAHVGILKDNFYVCPGHLKGKSNSKQCGGHRIIFVLPGPMCPLATSCGLPLKKQT
jgi:hypothetical protein